MPEIVPEEYHLQRGLQSNNFEDCTHPLTNSSRRYICGDTFQNKNNPHKSLLCQFHNIDLCLQAGSIKKAYQESMFNRRQKMKAQQNAPMNGPNGIMMHVFHNYLMNYYKNEEIVLRQKRELESSSGKNIKRDSFMRFITCD